MIRANELRYGNKVRNQRGEVITVQQILCNTLIYDTQLSVSRETAQTRGAYRTAFAAEVTEVVKEADFNDIEPITLTPRILEKCGFRNFVREEWIFTSGSSHIDFEYTSEGLRLRHPTPSRVSIRYVHQLQNFLFAITGMEWEPGF
ncbi:MAG: hypothetical protein Q8932_10760 [Bacteroidota bacterium]|nr:hypothetical protein [Bacteroidota bacterium]MDP4246317.1 hypothetical protein [Bacteroidota bacterium]MDP4253091.1 hypothetical protein [Bacteroidota bacterium]MDP4259804.1 hypothetical protein [Bacteroidota bacterium]